MSYQSRYISDQIRQDIEKKMVFVGGPRQVGKTTLAKHLLASKEGYLNWDIPQDRERILKRELPAVDFWVFDEIHKYNHWRNYLKGVYDQFNDQKRILVTGSARLDYYRRGGDSLQGRYHYLRLHPLSVSELDISHQDDFNTLLQLGGFPEPFMSGSEIEAKRWSSEYRHRVVQEDINTLENVRDLGTLELLMLRLPNLVGSPLSLNSIREDLQVSHKTVANWIDILERLYAIFRLSPFGSPKIRAVKKEQKHYHYDWSIVESKGERFENLVASHLLKWVHFQQDTLARDLELRYFRDIDGREVDFIITEKGEPIIAVECKWKDTEISKHLQYFKKRFPNCQAWQLIADTTKDFVTAENIRVTQAIHFLKTLV